MKSVSDYQSSWSGGATTPELNQTQWNLLAIPAAVLAVMAILQIISFGTFKDWLNQVGVGWSAAAAAVIIIAELWGAVSLLRVPMNRMLRSTGILLAVLVSGFWFIYALQLVSGGAAGQLTSSGFFGKYLNQSPGWWTVIEASIGLFWLVYAAELLKPRPSNR